MMRERMMKLVILVSLLAMGGCATLPTGPSVLVLPAPGKSLEQFRDEDVICRQWASQQVGASPQETANKSAVSGAALGTAIGAGAGALLGAASGDPAAGAAIGAGSGLIIGTAAGAGAGQEYGYDTQRRYDYAYVQCMYVKGNQIPGQVHRYRLRRAPTTPPPGFNAVPPDYVPETAPDK